MTNSQHAIPLAKQKAEEIILDLEKMFHLLDRFHYFQSPLYVSEENSDEKYLAHIAILNSFSNEIVFRPLSSTKSFPEFKSKKFKIQNQSGNIFFYTSQSSLARAHYLNLRMPKEIHIINYRECERYNLDDLKLRVESLDSHTGQTFISQLIDISASGLALKSLDTKFESFQSQQQFILQKIGPHFLDSHFSAHVIYVRKIQSPVVTTGIFQVGAKFTTPIDINAFLNMVKNK